MSFVLSKKKLMKASLMQLCIFVMKYDLYVICSHSYRRLHNIKYLLCG